jgi:predicted RNA binding protein YcfA (HicA-like mRNA interferase family)
MKKACNFAGLFHSERKNPSKWQSHTPLLNSRFELVHLNALTTPPVGSVYFCVSPLHYVYLCVKFALSTFGTVNMQSTKLIRMLKEDGWQEVRIKGSHHHFKHPTKKGLVTVPHPKKDLPEGTVISILKQASLK